MRAFVSGIAAAALIVTFGLTGCGKKSGTCEAAVENTFKVMMKELPEELKKEMTGDKLKEEKKEAIEKCKKENPPKELLACMANASDMKAMEKCEEKHEKK